MNMFRYKWTKRFEEEKRVLKMEETRAVNRIEANLPQEKIDFINDVHAKEVNYCKRIALAH